MRRAFFFIGALLFATTSFASIPRVSALDAAPPIADSLAETRIGVSDVLAPFERPAESGLTRALRHACEHGSTTNASGLRWFLSVDPDQWYTKQNGTDDEKRAFQINLRRPQGWNRYSYAYNNPVRYTDPDGKIVLVDDAAIGLIILGTVAVAATHTYLQSPNASDPSRTNAQVMGSQIQSALTGLMSPIIQAQNNRQTNKVVNGLIAAAATELGKVSSGGGPEKDPDFRGHKKEIKAMLDRAVELAKRLPKKAQEEIMRQVREIGGGVGLTY